MMSTLMSAKLSRFYADLRTEFETVGAGSGDVVDKLAHIERVTEMAKRVAGNDALFVACAQFHDLLGRLEQFKVLSKAQGVGVFEDAVLDHHVLAENAIRRMVHKGDWQSSDWEHDCIRAVAMYHGPEKFVPEHLRSNAQMMYYIRAISVLDDIDNGCMGALSYIEREIVEDAKAAMLSKNGGTTLEIRSSGVVSGSVLEHFKKLEKFDKFAECRTYADYLLFAIIIGFQFLRSEYKDLRELALDSIHKSCGRYASAIEGYHYLIENYICPEQRDDIWALFMSHVEDQNEEAGKMYFDA